MPKKNKNIISREYWSVLIGGLLISSLMLLMWLIMWLDYFPNNFLFTDYNTSKEQVKDLEKLDKQQESISSDMIKVVTDIRQVITGDDVNSTKKPIISINWILKEQYIYDQLILDWLIDKFQLSWLWLNINNVRVYDIDLFNEDIIFSYDKKPEFDIIRWWEYINSWNSIIFWSWSLVLKLKNNTKFVLNTIWDANDYGNIIQADNFIIINNVSLLSRFKYIEYRYKTIIIKSNYDNKKHDEYFGNNIGYLSDLQSIWYGWELLLNWFKRKSNDLKTVKLFKLVPSDEILVNNILYSENDWQDKDEFIYNGKNVDLIDKTSLINYVFSWTDLVIKFDWLDKASKYTLLVDDWTNKFITNMSIIDDYKQLYDRNLVYENTKLNNYHICTTQPFDEDRTRMSLNDAIWSWNIDVVFSVTDIDYLDRQNNNNCLMFYYYLPPDTKKNYNVKLYSIYGDYIETIIEIWPYKIPDQFKFRTIVWNQPYNILPKNWAFWDNIKITYKNYEDLDLFIQECSFESEKLVEKLIWGLSKWWYYDINELLIWCGWKYYEHKIKFTDFERWKYKSYDIFLSKIIENKDLWIFTVWFDKQNMSKIFIRTNLWIYNKISEDKVYIWVNELDSWDLAKDVDLKILWLPDDLFQLNKENKFKLEDYTKDIHGFSWFAIIDKPKNMKLWYIIAKKWDDKSISSLSNESWLYYDVDWSYIDIDNSSFIERWDLWVNDYWWNESSHILRLYAYSDRVLYKPWDTIYVSGWIRHLESRLNWNKPMTWEVQIKLNKDWEIASQTINNIDEFGWFKWEFKLPKSANLWLYDLTVTYNDWSYSDVYTYYVNVEEFKKSSYFVSTELVQNDKWDHFVRVEPKYYFGWWLKSIDYNISWSFRWSNYGVTDWNWCNSQYGWCDEPIIYNQTWWDDQVYWWDYSMDNYTWWYVDIPISIDNIRFNWDLLLSIRIKDSLSKEVVNKEFVKKLYPKNLIWFKWRDYDYKNISDWKVNLEWRLLRFDKDRWAVLDNYKSVEQDKITLIVYFKNYGIKEGKWVDWEYYYTNWDSYTKILEKEVQVKDWLFKEQIKFDWAWKYFIRALYTWDLIDSAYEVQKTISVYDYGWWSYIYNWDLQNNMKLIVTTKDKEYVPWDDLNINIEPYIKWSNAIITVEQGNQILEVNNMKLDWSPISLKVKDSWFPNVFISVAIILWEKQNWEISENRKEPRFMLWYSDVKLSNKIVTLNYDIKVSDKNWIVKDYYNPWEKVKLTVNVTDWQWTPIKTRLSIWVVDKALIDIYDEIRQPMEYFYNKFGNYIYAFSNMKFLYKALNVFTANGSKWWWGWGFGWWWLYNVRNVFYDLLFWKWGIFTDDKWHFESDIVLSDNLTTRVVDIIWITADQKMWTQRSYFKVSKEIVLEPNSPRFVTYGDLIDIWGKVVFVTPEIESKYKDKIKIIWHITIWDKKIELENIGYKDWSITSKLDMNKIDFDTIYRNEYISIYMVVKNGEKILDWMEYKIPIRKDWFVLSKYLFKLTDSYSWSIDLWEWVKQWIVSLTVALNPVDAFQKAFKYLLHYPYGCTEQMMSWLYPIIVADELQRWWFIGDDLVRNSKVNLQGSWESINDIVDDTLLKLYKNQKSDGGMWFWEYPSESSSVYLTTYVYWVFNKLSKLWYKVDQNILNKLEKYILEQDDPIVLIYYYMQRSFDWAKDINEKYIIENMYVSDASKVLWYVALSNIWSKYAKWLETQIDSFFMSDNITDISESYFSFMEKDILKAFYIRWLIKNWNIDKAWNYLMDLYKSRDNQWLWWWSTQKNVQILLAIWDYLKFLKIDKSTDYELFINNNKLTWILDKNNQSKTYNLLFNNQKNISIELKSTNKLMMDAHVEYILDDFDKIKDEKNNVSEFNLNAQTIEWLTWNTINKLISDQKIWDMIKFIGDFNITKSANQLAVVYYIPSNIVLMNVIGKNNAINDECYPWEWCDYDDRGSVISYENIWNLWPTWYSCMPDNYEIRFDRLFLYYNSLPKWAHCRVSFLWYKTHNWDTQIMPSKLFEMYKTDVWAQKIAK